MPVNLVSVLRCAVTTIACATLASWGGAAFAWSARAHQMVADIGTQYLTPTAMEAVAELLRDDLAANGKPSGRATLGQVASWADELREVDRSVGPYHFDDVPLCGEQDRSKYCKDGKCATAWFAKQVAVLKDPSQPARARNEALKWIVHLVGDLHQPLHSSDDDDKGGNDVKITFLGLREDPPVAGRASYPYNLHTAWDRLIPYRLFDSVGGYDRFLAALPTPATRADWEVGTLDEWAMESYVLSRDFVYPAMPTDWTCGTKLTQVVALDARYDAAAEAIAGMQIQKAGVRLAKVLNDLLSKSNVGNR
jgi:hypothetical protein